MGHVGGTQVSLFDVSDLATPMRLATFALAAAVSDAEFDPHAFLYWPGSHLVVVPVQVPGPVPAAPVTPGELAQSPDGPHSGALVLRIDDSGITETGLVSQPDTGHASGLAWFPPIERSLIIGQTLWTISNAGAMASDLTSLRQLTDDELTSRPHHLPARQHLPRHMRQPRRRPAAFPAAPAGCAHASHGGAACHRDRTCPLIGLAGAGRDPIRRAGRWRPARLWRARVR